jgi:hypothetical protein
MTLPQLRSKFDGILSSLNSNPTVNFCSAVESAYEAYVLARVIKEYARVYGGVTNIVHPSSSSFLNQKPGKFRTTRAFKVTYNSGGTFYFATDIEVYGLTTMQAKAPLGVKFEADVVVIHEHHVQEVDQVFRGYPAPQHLDSVYECKFGTFSKGQLRELLGLRRHISMLHGSLYLPSPPDPNALDYRPVRNASPSIGVKMARPKQLDFFDIHTQLLYDLQQIVIN